MKSHKTVHIRWRQHAANNIDKQKRRWLWHRTDRDDYSSEVA